MVGSTNFTEASQQNTERGVLIPAELEEFQRIEREWFEKVFHYCMRIEFQGCGIVHIHIALWAITKAALQLEGRNTDDYEASAFVSFLSSVL